MFRPKHFILQELVDPLTFTERGERAWELLRTDALVMLQSLRDKFGRTIVNNWHASGRYEESGFRRFDSMTGAPWSLHRFGGAFDCKFRDTTTREAYDYVLAHPEEFPALTTLENIDDTPGWLHADTRNHDRPGIWIVNA